MLSLSLRALKMKLTGLALITAVTASRAAISRRQASSGSNATTISDISVIQRYWGQITPYFDNNETFFGVNNTGLPDSCQVEQAHLLERHGARFPTGGMFGT